MIRSKSSYEEASKELDRITAELQQKTETPIRSPSFASSFENKVSPHSYSSPLSKSPSYNNRTMQYKDPVYDHSSFHLPPKHDTFYSSFSTAGGSFVSTPLSDTSKAVNSATSVISAFRELQDKAKALEQERFAALRERDELRQRIADRRRHQALLRSRQEMEATESFLNVRSSNEKLKLQFGDLEAKLHSQENINQSIERGRGAQRTMISSLQDDVAHNNARIYTLERQISLSQSELNAILKRSKSVEQTATSSPKKNRRMEEGLDEELASLEQQLRKAQRSKAHKVGQIESLHDYVELMVKINGELCATLSEKERARAEILRLAGKVVPPHYAWPKEIPYNNILEIINEAARMTAEAAVRNTALRASEEAAQSIVQALAANPGSRSSSPQRGRSRQRSPQKLLQAPDSSRSEWLYHRDRHDAERSNSRIMDNPYGGGNTKLDKYISFISEAAGVELDNPHHRRRSSSTSAIDRRKHKTGSRHVTKYHPTDYEQREDEATKRAISRQGAVTYATRFAAAANAAATTTAVHNTPTPPLTTAMKLAASNALMERDRSLSPSPERYRRHQPSYSREYSASRERRRALDDSVLGTSIAATEVPVAKRASFIPSGNQNSEFNIVASVSKASRAAKHLNAAIASKVKSLQYGGAGELFENSVNRVSLQDMQQHLQAVKRMTS